MNLEQLLNLLPYTIGGYALEIRRFYNSTKKADMWEVAYRNYENEHLFWIADMKLESVALQTIKYLFCKGFGRKNCANCTKYKGCFTCVDGSMKETV